MNYHSRTGFGHVRWPWWHDVLICGGVLAAIGVLHALLG